MLSKDLDNAPTTRPPNHHCGIALMLWDVENKEGKAEALRVEAILNDKDRVATTLSKVLKANGFNITDQTIRRHRRRQCSCQ